MARTVRRHRFSNADSIILFIKRSVGDTRASVWLRGSAVFVKTFGRDGALRRPRTTLSFHFHIRGYHYDGGQSFVLGRIVAVQTIGLTLGELRIGLSRRYENDSS